MVSAEIPYPPSSAAVENKSSPASSILKKSLISPTSLRKKKVQWRDEGCPSLPSLPEKENKSLILAVLDTVDQETATSSSTSCSSSNSSYEQQVHEQQHVQEEDEDDDHSIGSLSEVISDLRPPPSMTEDLNESMPSLLAFGNASVSSGLSFNNSSFASFTLDDGVFSDDEEEEDDEEDSAVNSSDKAAAKQYWESVGTDCCVILEESTQ